jgi:dienelactone hydrolase
VDIPHERPNGAPAVIRIHSPRLGFILASLALIAAGPLPGTKPWEMPADPAKAMVDGCHAYLDAQIRGALARRDGRWDRNNTSVDAYTKSVDPQREHLATILGTTDDRARPVVVTYLAGPGIPAPLASNDKVAVTAVRWSVYPGFEAEGLLVEPAGDVRANIVALPDADATPESLVWAAPGTMAESADALRLAEAGCRVLIPRMIDRATEFSGSPLVRFTNLTHREWIYRMAYETGRHVIGYEVDAARAAVDWFTRLGQPKLPIGVVGHGEGGLIALHAAAIDGRIDAAWVAGHFGPREGVWSEPIYRNVWNLLVEFGDAEVASLITPRAVTIEACRGPEVAGPPKPVGGRSDAASGRITTPPPNAVAAEFERLLEVAYQGAGAREPKLIRGEAGAAFNEGNRGLTAFLRDLKLEPASPGQPLPADPRPAGHDRIRMGRLVTGMVGYTQALLRTSELRRDAYWSKAVRKSPAAWEASTESYRSEFTEEFLGKLRPFDETRTDVFSVQVYDEPRWTGYAVKLDMDEDLFASGVLLLPKDLKPGERRPVVVCQHGLEGTPKPIVDPRVKSVYNSFGAQLADRGYIVYAPQNPYIGGDRFRQLQRKANPLGRTLFSIIVAQHARTLNWLKSRPEVDPARIAFYGLSYGGKTAMRVPAVLKDYCLSICSADFNEWAVKCTNLDRKYSYLYTIEYDMYEFGLAERFNYADMAGLIAPRPFLVERGHEDGVAPDEWVAYEYAKVKRLYDSLGIGDRTDLAIFNGGHQIDGKESFAFLARHLNWTRGASAP